MNSFEQDKDLIIEWLADNRHYLLQELFDVRLQFENLLELEPKEMHEDIERDFRQAIEFFTQTEIQKHLNVCLDHVIVIVQDINIVNYLYEDENEYVQHSD